MLSGWGRRRRTQTLRSAINGISSSRDTIGWWEILDVLCSLYLERHIAAGREDDDVEFMVGYNILSTWGTDIVGCGGVTNPSSFRLGSPGYLQIESPRASSSSCDPGSNNGDDGLVQG